MRLGYLRSDEILMDWDPETASKDENKLRSKLMKDAGKFCGLGMKAESRDATSDEPKADAKRGKARSKFESKGDKTIAKGEKKGFEDPGLDVGAMADDVDEIVDAFKELTAGMEGETPIE